MNRLCVVVCTATLCWLLGEAALAVRATRRVAENVVAVVDHRVAELGWLADARLGEAIAVLDRRLASIEQRATAQLAGAVQAAERQVTRGLEAADARLGETLEEVRQLRLEAQAAVSEARSLIVDARRAAARFDYWTDCEQNGLCWQGAATDVLLAVRRAALSVDRAMPRIVEAAEGSAAGVQATAQASAQTAENLARLTRPGPRWLRYVGLGLGVAAPASQVALPFVVRRAEIK